MQKLVLAVLVLAALFALSHAAARQISVNKSRVLSLHNGERKLKRVAGLRWNATAARKALAYAKRCKYAHDPNRGNYGENLGASTASSVVDSSLRLFNAEKKYWNCRTNRCQAGKVCGHYTQVVWEKTRSVGCAAVQCSSGSPFGRGSWYFFVCRYSGPGNYIGQRPFATSKC